MMQLAIETEIRHFHIDWDETSDIFLYLTLRFHKMELEAIPERVTFLQTLAV